MLDIKNMFATRQTALQLPVKLKLLLPSDGYGLNAMILNAVGGWSAPACHPAARLPRKRAEFGPCRIAPGRRLHVLFFHYKGAWGSPGFFTFEDVLRDANSALIILSSRKLRHSTG